MQFVKKVVESRFDYGICKSKKLWLSFFFSLLLFCFAWKVHFGQCQKLEWPLCHGDHDNSTKIIENISNKLVIFLPLILLLWRWGPGFTVICCLQSNVGQVINKTAIRLSQSAFSLQLSGVELEIPWNLTMWLLTVMNWQKLHFYPVYI